jgi:tape measure domain-containing protein
MPNVDIGTVSGRLTIQDQFTSVLKKANADLRDFTDRSERDFGKIRDLASKVGTGMMAASAATGALGLGLVKAAAAAEQTGVAFTTLLGSGQAAQKMLGQLRDFAAKTPFEFNDLTAATRKMLAFGFSAKDIIPDLTAVGDAAAGLGMGAEGIDRVITALGQMRAKTKVSAEEMMQLTEAGIPGWNILSQAIGKSVSETMKLAEKGVIPADKAIQALLGGMSGKFGGLMAKQAETANGQWSTLKDTIDKLAVDFGTVLLPAAKDATKWLQGVANTINGWSPALKRSVAVWSEWGVGITTGMGGLALVSIKLVEIADKMKALGIASFAGRVAGPVGIAAGIAGALKWASDETTAEHERRKKAAHYQVKLPPDMAKLWAQYENNPPGSDAATSAAWEIVKRGWKITETGPVPPSGIGPAEKGRTSYNPALAGMGYVETRQGLLPAKPGRRWKEPGGGGPLAPMKFGVAGVQAKVRTKRNPADEINWSFEHTGTIAPDIEMADLALRPETLTERIRREGAILRQDLFRVGSTGMEAKMAQPARDALANWWDYAGWRLGNMQLPSGGLGGVARVIGGIRDELGALAQARNWQTSLAGIGAMPSIGNFDVAMGAGLQSIAIDSKISAALATFKKGGPAARPSWWKRNSGALQSGMQNAFSIYSGIQSMMSGEGGMFGGAMSGASVGGSLANVFGMSGPWGALAGGIVGAIFGSNASAQAEEERRHQEAQRKRDALADAMKRVANQLTPVSDYFRSGMGTLTGTSTFGAQLALDAALGG